MNFIPLHLYSGYSFLKSGILFPKLISSLKKNDFNVVGLSDLNVMYGYPSFNKICLENNIKPIFGLDLIVNENLFTLYVKNENGYKNLCQISTFLEKKDGFCKDFSEIKDFLYDLICVISTKQSKIFKTINEGIFTSELYKINKYFNDDFYIGLEIYNQNDKLKANLIKEFATSHSYNLIAFPHIKYLEKNDYKILEILKAINDETNVETIEDEISKNNYLRNKEEISSLYDFKEINALQDLINKINFNFLVKRGELLHFTKSMNISSKDLLKELILESLKKHNIDLTKNVRYRNRLNKEFIIIDNMNYCDYFLIVQDYVNYAKNNNIPVGPGRGSVGGSLIAYLLGITEVDPLKFNDLLFERFLNPERNSMPDIDIDFSDVEREKVINYIINKYGKERTSRVIAFQTIGAKQALRDVGRVYRYDSNDIEQLSKAIPSNFNQNNYTLEDCANNIPAFKELIKDGKTREIYEYAKLIEGFPRQKGLHAAGVIINDKSLLNLIPLTYLDENTYVTQYEKDFLEDQGFLKMDLLGLTALSTIQKTLDLINKNHHIDLKINEIPYESKEIFDLIRQNHTMGIFQLDTSAANKGISYLKPTCFKDIVDLLALDRPGPMEQIPLYASRKEKKSPINYLDKSLIPILKDTYGIIVYQEQIMQIARIYAGFSYAEADIFRRAVSKKHKEELLKMESKFLSGAKALNRNEVTSKKIFDLILKFASYGFNKAHSVPYSMISCRMAYLKANYPLEFYASILEAQYGNNDIKFNKYLSEIRQSKIKISVPNINESTLNFEIYDNTLLMPLTNIGGLPSKLSLQIINERNAHGKFTSFINFVQRMYATNDKITELQLSKLIDAGCFDSLNNNRKSLKSSILDALKFSSASIYQEGKLIDNTYGLSYQDKDVAEDYKTRLENEYNVLGSMISDSPFNHLDKSKLNDVTNFENLVANNSYWVFGIIKNIKTITIKNGTHKGEPMAFIDIYNEFDEELSLTLFSDIYAKYQNVVDADLAIKVYGKYEVSSRRPTLIVKKLIVIGGNKDVENNSD